MRTKLIHLMIAASFIGALLIATVPTAEAQQQGALSLTITAPTEGVKPLRGALTVSGKVDFNADPSVSAQLVGVPVSYTVSKFPSWASVTVSPSSDVLTPSGTSQTFTASKTFSISITASDQAPAFQSDTVEITATTNPGSGGNTQSQKATFPIFADYFSIIDVQLAETIKVDRPQTPVTFPLKITNFGNANTKVSFEIVDKPANLQVPIPNPITLQSKQAGGNQITADVPLTIQTPYKNGYMNEVGIVSYKITSAYALDPKLKGDESSVSVVVTTKGFYVPGPSPLLMVGLLGIAAALFRRR